MNEGASSFVVSKRCSTLQFYIECLISMTFEYFTSAFEYSASCHENSKISVFLIIGEEASSCLIFHYGNTPHLKNRSKTQILLRLHNVLIFDLVRRSSTNNT
jgi:hypothetical protein